MERKKILQKVIIGSGSLITMPVLFNASPVYGIRQPPTDQLPADKVKKFVIAGHGDLTKVKSMLQELPALLYATWDWG